MSVLHGWAGKIILVDLGERKITEMETEPYSERFVGGIGISQKCYWDDVPVSLDAFYPDNPLILMSGPLEATPAPSAPRLIACGKSPSLYPEAFNYASLGGSFAAELKNYWMSIMSFVDGMSPRAS